MGTSLVVIPHSYKETSFQGPGQTSLSKTLQKSFLLLAQSISQGSPQSALKYCSTQRAALSPLVVHSLFSFAVHYVFEYALMPCLQQLLSFKKKLKAVIFSGRTLCNFTTAADTEQMTSFT